MIIKNKYFFSPKILLKDLNTDNVIEAFRDRIEKWYLEPIKILNNCEFGFAATALLASVIDILAKTSNYDLKNENNKKKYTKWIIEKFNFSKDDAENFYEHFRCGLIHSGCIESGGYVNYKQSEFYREYKNSLIVNPIKLLKKLEEQLDDLIINEDPEDLLDYLNGRLKDL